MRVEFFVVCNDMRKHPGATIRLPVRATAASCAYDFCTPVRTVIQPKDKMLLWTDVKASMPRNVMLALNLRSGVAIRHTLLLANMQGWIDADYFNNPDNDGNIGVLLYNYGDASVVLPAGERVAQGMFLSYFCSDDHQNAVRNGGFGSTGK